MTGPLWHILQTSDSAFPVGGFAHSHGLEGFTQTGDIHTTDDLRRVITTTWMPSLAHLDFPLIRLTHAAARDDAAIVRLDQIARACRLTAETRRAQTLLGQQRLKLVAGLTQQPDLLRWLNTARQGRWHTQWPVVWGLEAAFLELDLDNTLTAFGYQSINGLVTAAMKLIRIGPTEAQTILYETHIPLAHAITRSANIPEDQLGWFTPRLDIASAQHETAYTRIFIS